MKNGIKGRTITHPTRRWTEGAYSEIENDEEWLAPDAWVGGDDHHCDMVNYEPSDVGLISWVIEGHIRYWIGYVAYWDDTREAHASNPDPFGIRIRIKELLERYEKFKT